MKIFPAAKGREDHHNRRPTAVRTLKVPPHQERSDLFRYDDLRPVGLPTFLFYAKPRITKLHLSNTSSDKGKRRRRMALCKLRTP